MFPAVVPVTDKQSSTREEQGRVGGQIAGLCDDLVSEAGVQMNDEQLRRDIVD